MFVSCSRVGQEAAEKIAEGANSLSNKRFLKPVFLFNSIFVPKFFNSKIFRLD